MFQRRFALLAMLFVLLLVPTVFATPRESYLAAFKFTTDSSYYAYCIWTVDEFLDADGMIEGCVVQENTPGRAAHGTLYAYAFPFDGFDPEVDPDTIDNHCEYNLATFDIPGQPGQFNGPPQFTANRCVGPEWQGLHIRGTSDPSGYFRMNIHQEPN